MKNQSSMNGLNSRDIAVAGISSLFFLIICIWGVIQYRPWARSFDGPFLMAAPAIFGIATAYVFKGVVRLCR